MSDTLDPRALALQYKDALNATGVFIVQPDGQVKMSADRGGGYAPPWSWAPAIPPASGNDAQSMALRVKLATPASDPSSVWHDMFQGGGAFKHQSAWDSQTGTYKSSIDWGTLLGTIAAGGIIGSGVAAAASGGAAAADSPAFIAAGGESSLTGGVPAAVAGVAPAAAPAVAPAVAPGTTAAVAPSLGRTILNAATSPSGLGVYGNIVDTLLTNSANKSAAEEKAAADKYAADLLDAANKRAELFSRQTAENQWLNSEGTRKANYDLWAEREGRFSSLGAALGLAPRNTPKYTPGIDPHFNDWDPNNPFPTTPSTTTPPGTTTPPASTWDPNKFAAIVGRPPTQAETAFYQNVPTWEIDVRNAAGGGKPTTPGQYGGGYRG